MPQTIMVAEELQSLISGDKTVVVFFCAIWNGHSNFMQTVFDSYENHYPNAVFVKVDVDVAPDIAADYKVDELPVFKFFKGGAEVASMVGGDQFGLGSLCETHCK
ncbi:uncharacterized protein LOC142338617 [Convolutriloba macropyga]|uniref:uncharacterized protein LOC142338617 n=1 Tax=Convolutriloba macropyga TaxID=536237 RepID=UPI003F521B4C